MTTCLNCGSELFHCPDDWPICTPTKCHNMTTGRTSTARKRAEAKRSEKNILEIDENRLEKEWAEQAPLFYQYASELVDARLKQDEAKAELEVTMAELDSAIRADPETFGVERISEGAIKNTILQQSSYQLALESFNGTSRAVRMLEAMTRALEHRKSALKSMVELRLANYYAEPTLPREKNEAREEMNKATVRARGRRRRETS